ncbi:MAG: winged helix DNA-binding domain-containing protein [Chloroflexota bacterium]
MNVDQVNAYVAAKQHLWPRCQTDDALRTTRAIVALHASAAPSPYLSLRARMAGFRRADLEEALYERRQLARVLCMRQTLHVVASDEYQFFHAAYAARFAALEQRRGEETVVQAGLCPPEEAADLLARLRERVVAAVEREGPLTVAQLAARIPELAARLRLAVGRAYEAEVSAGSRLVPGLCTLGALVRTRPRGGWRGNLYAYARLADWLPALRLEATTAPEARAWLLRRYLGAFGPARLEDAQWWTGLPKGEITRALRQLGDAVARVGLDDLGDDFLVLAAEEPGLAGWRPPEQPQAFLLPALDPYVMGYRDRARFLRSEYQTRVFDGAGNARPTVWLHGRIVGTWLNRAGTAPRIDLLEPLEGAAAEAVRREEERLIAFLAEAG